MSKTLRLLMPQWQGGNNPSYPLGARLLAWLAPHSSEVIEIPIEPYDRKELPLENGVIARTALLNQLASATNIIEEHQPERIILFGGDCLVAQASFAYLNEKYQGNLGVLWLDAHPDVSTPQMFAHVHAMVLGNLLGEEDPEFAAKVKVPLKPELVMYGGLQPSSSEETEIIDRLNLSRANPKELTESSQSVLDWIKEKNIQHLAIHLDLDVLDPKQFRSLLFAKPGGEPIDAPQGEMTFAQIARLIQDVSKETDVVGIAIAEHLPWDAINLQNFLVELPILND